VTSTGLVLEEVSLKLTLDITVGFAVEELMVVGSRFWGHTWQGCADQQMSWSRAPESLRYDVAALQTQYCRLCAESTIKYQSTN